MLFISVWKRSRLNERPVVAPHPQPGSWRRCGSRRRFAQGTHHRLPVRSLQLTPDFFDSYLWRSSLIGQRSQTRHKHPSRVSNGSRSRKTGSTLPQENGLSILSSPTRVRLASQSLSVSHPASRVYCGMKSLVRFIHTWHEFPR